RKHAMGPPAVDVLELVRVRARRYLTHCAKVTRADVRIGDSRVPETWEGRLFRWIITSPPYYGMRTYIPDQWLRNWFVGGPAIVDYSMDGQLAHTSKDKFALGLERVWINCANVARHGCRMVIRFGAINDRKIDPIAI